MWLVFLIIVLGVAGYAGIAGIRRVEAGYVGIVTKKIGRRRPGDDPRISVSGGSGVQAKILNANAFNWLPPFMYSVDSVPQTHVPNGTIGVVVAKAGLVRPPGSTLAEHVDCDHFRDGVRFLTNGGQQGRQQEVLTGGFYDINTELFEVITVETLQEANHERLTPADLEEVQIQVGETGVVITHVGARPDEDPGAVGRHVDGHESFQLPWQFVANGGQKGVQKETLDEGGRYVINPWFAHVVRIPTRILMLEWSKEKKADSNLDAPLDQIVLDVQGHTVRLDMKQTVQIPAETAPFLVRRFGDPGGSSRAAGRAPVQQFVERDLAATVSGYFRRISAQLTIKDFATKYEEVCIELAGEVRRELQTMGVVAVRTILEEFTCDEPEINELRRRIALQKEQVHLEKARLGDLHAQLANEQVHKLIELNKIDVERERKKLDYVELSMLVEQLGAQHVSLERLIREYVKANVPQTIVDAAGGDVLQAMLLSMPSAQVKETIMALTGDSANSLAQPEQHPAVTNGQTTPQPGENL
jgi:hypothetical protein